MFQLSNRTILLVSPEPWDHIFVSKHHYAVFLARKQNKVFFLGPPSTVERLEVSPIPGLYLLSYKGFIKGLRFYPPFVQRLIITKVYSRLEKLCSTSFDVIWSFDNSVFFDFSALPSHALKISHIVDLNQNFQMRRAARTADYCFCTSDLIRRRLQRYNSNVFKINHGYNFKEQPTTISQSRGRPLAVYAGNLGMPYIDWELFSAVVSAHPEVNFLFIGPNHDKPADGSMGKAKQKVVQSKNCAFMGQVDSGSLQGYYVGADVLLVAYQERYHADQANPHKMMEYLGSGNVVVATYTSEYVDLAARGLIRMSHSNAAFPLLFREVLAALEHWNGKELKEARKTIALCNSYGAQIERMEKIIEK